MKLFNVLCVCTALMNAGTAAAATPQHSYAELSTLSVSAEVELSVAADLASFNIGVQNSAAQAQTALDENNRLMQQLLSSLKAAGVLPEELSSGPLSVQPQWQPRPRNADQNWRPQIISYQARSQLLIETAQLDKVAGFIQAGVEAGANQVGQLKFGLQDDETVHQQALADATKLAGQRASIAANAAGVKLGSLHRINVGPRSSRPYPVARTAMLRMSDESAAAPVVAAGTIEVSASVDLSYLIQ
ncbi:MAG: SIMPL domain-containing protein [Motiliproteus sp.]